MQSFDFIFWWIVCSYASVAQDDSCFKLLGQLAVVVKELASYFVVWMRSLVPALLLFGKVQVINNKQKENTFL